MYYFDFIRAIEKIDPNASSWINLNRQDEVRSITHKHEYPAVLLCDSFPWIDTPQGSTYWYNIYDKLLHSKLPAEDPVEYEYDIR